MLTYPFFKQESFRLICVGGISNWMESDQTAPVLGLGVYFPVFSLSLFCFLCVLVIVEKY